MFVSRWKRDWHKVTAEVEALISWRHACTILVVTVVLLRAARRGIIMVSPPLLVQRFFLRSPDLNIAIQAESEFDSDLLRLAYLALGGMDRVYKLSDNWKTMLRCFPANETDGTVG